MASNLQAGTRGLSAADWTRLKRIQGSREFQASSMKTRNGSSIIEFPASEYTDFVAQNTADFVSQREVNLSVAKILIRTELCSCSQSLLLTKLTGCAKCNL